MEQLLAELKRARKATADALGHVSGLLFIINNVRMYDVCEFRTYVVSRACGKHSVSC
jgi:hypothetical protein